MEYYTFPCGCSWPIVGPPPIEGAMPLVDIDDESLPDCPKVWELISSGFTKGIFQVDTETGKEWCRKVKPQSIEQLAAVSAILRPGCISSDTKIAEKIVPRVGRTKNYKTISMEKLYKKFKRKHPSYENTIVSIDEKELLFFNNKIKDAYYSGKKDIYKPLIKIYPVEAFGFVGNLECTLDHKLLTNKGWLALSEIQIGDRIACVSKIRLKDKVFKNSFQTTCFYNYEYKCVFCDWSEASLDVNHLEGNRYTNNKKDNLCYMCPNHHRMYSDKLITKEEIIKARQKHELQVTQHISWGEYQGKEFIGNKDTYDIEVEGTNNNFIAGNIIVHNSAKAYDEEGVSMSDHYARRKNGLEEVPPYHPAIDPILAPTYGCLIYQEQASAIAVAVAGFSPTDADSLRKAIGKKLAEEMAKVKRMFLEGVEKTKVISKEMGDELFGWIEKSQRYSFNKCFLGTTIIRRSGKNKYSTIYTIEEMFNIRNNIEYAKATGHLSSYKQWKLWGNYGKGLSLCQDGRIRQNTILDINYAGKATVYKVLLENDSYVYVTNNHKFPTPNGEKMLCELKVDDELFICGEYEKNNSRKYKFSDLTNDDRKEQNGTSGNGIFGKENRWFTNGSYSEFKKNDKIIPQICADCGITKCRLELHHNNGDRSNSSLKNLTRLCASCHKIREYANGRVKRGEKGYPSLLCKIVSIQEFGEEDVYDVTMEGPNHNLVVNDNIVTSNSHAISYALLGYDTAYAKVHIPAWFYGNWLAYSKDSQDTKTEIAELVSDAKNFDTKILTPDIRKSSAHFSSDGLEVLFGLFDVKGIGEKQVQKILNVTQGKLQSWESFLFQCADHIESRAAQALISVGGFDWCGKTRTRMLNEYNAWMGLTDKEKLYILDKCKHEDGLSTCMKYCAATRKMGGGCTRKDRVEKVRSIFRLLDNPPASEEDSPSWINWVEKELLGVALTCSKVDACDATMVNTSCKDFLNGKKGYMLLGVEVLTVKEYMCKNDTKMAFLSVSDSSCSLPNVVVFSDVYKDKKTLLTEGNTVLIRGERDEKKGSLIAKEIYQL